MEDVTLHSIVDALAANPCVDAVLLAGSRTNDTADELSDTDLYVYGSAAPHVSARRGAAERFADEMEIDNQFWETEDLWIVRDGGEKVELMYRTFTFVRDELQRIYDRHEARVGYSTCVAANFLSSDILFDRDGRVRELQRDYMRPYPDELVQHIIDRNFPLLGRSFSSYTHQILAAVFRGDLISVNHRIAAYVASYFDILFALIRTLHPGEKKMMKILSRSGSDPLPGLAEDLQELFSLGGAGDAAIEHILRSLTHRLRDRIIETGFRDLPD